nr:protein FAM32A [Nomia melanderi]
MPASNDDDPYAHAAKGLLKLKNDQGVSKKYVKNRFHFYFRLCGCFDNPEFPKIQEINRTKAEIAFQKMQEKMQTERIKQKASMTHKQRVEEFNRHLDSLTEHFDIPKVSWTK